MTVALGNPELHFWLTRSVARVMGVNLSDAIARDQLTPKGYADLVTECRGCPRVSSCQNWLAEQLDVTRTAPPGCRNSAALEGLARPHSGGSSAQVLRAFLDFRILTRWTEAPEVVWQHSLERDWLDAKILKTHGTI